jgi:ribosomal protein S18 acetylase RimI-like enzyme
MVRVASVEESTDDRLSTRKRPLTRSDPAIVEPLDPRNSIHVDGVVALHVRHFRPRLGAEFLRSFYYSKLVDTGLVRVTICRIGDDVIGFIAYTSQPRDYLSVGVRREFPSLARLIVRNLAVQPTLARSLRWLMYSTSEGFRKDLDALTGEVLYIATDPRHRDCVPQGGRSAVAVRLFESMKSFFFGTGRDKVLLVVNPKNVAAHRFFQAMGCRSEAHVYKKGTDHQFTMHHFFYDFARETAPLRAIHGRPGNRREAGATLQDASAPCSA